MVRFGDVSPVTGEWECLECGYVEEGIRMRRPKECPECGAPADAFDFFFDDEFNDEDWNSAVLDDEYEEDDENEEDFEDEDEY